MAENMLLWERNGISMQKNEQNERKPKSYSYKTRTDHVRLRIIDGLDSICEMKGPEAVAKQRYYDSYDFSKTDPEGSYTGIPNEVFDGKPVQDADDL